MVVNFCGFLDGLAFRRLHGVVAYKWPEGMLDALSADARTAYLVKNGAASLDSRYMALDSFGRIKRGGLFSLDGVHPTRVMYGLIAKVFLDSMKACGITRIDGGEPALDWGFVESSDTLLTSPPSMLRDLRRVLALLSGKIYGKTLFALLEHFKGNVG